MSQVVKDEEIYCLSHLINVVVDENEKIASGYRIHFYFEANPFFDNEIITKEFIMKPMTRTVSTNTPILWKEGKELSKPTLKTKGRKRRYERISFFHWIQDHSDPDNDDIAEMIKEDLWVNPLQFYCIFEDEEHFYNQNSSELRENGAVDDGDEDDVEIIDEEEVEEEEEDEELDEEEVEDEELLEEDGNEEEVTVIDDECKDA
ncbi:protein SET-like [Anabrus simplex]|uniref:protein SET-like n=1 Tax=Anabrus simplex TaxID=316456 RepID=UPI0035A32AFB